jgi:hypothetical protein
MKGDWFILLPDGKREGPYEEGELLDFLESGELSPDTPCLHISSNRVASAAEWFHVIDADDSDEPDDDAPASTPSSTTAPRTRQPWVPAPFPDEKPAPPKPLPDRVIYRGHPSVLTYWRTGLFAFVLAGGGFHLSDWHPETSALGLIAALLALLWGSLNRLSHCYLITTRRVEVITGLIARSSRELRHHDIRSINVERRGISGLLGIGTIIFSATGGREDDVAFLRVRRTDSLKDLVRKLQARATH